MSRLQDPAGSHYFALEIDGTEVAHFMGCSGVRTQASVFEIEEGGVNDYVHKRVGESTWSTITLRVGTHTSHALWDWRERCRGGDHAFRMSGAITMYDPAGRPVQRFSLKEVWPVRWKGPDPNASQSAIGVEELEISHEGATVS